MKTLKMLSIGIAMFFVNALQAQVSVNVNIGTPPPWGTGWIYRSALLLPT